MATVLTRRVRTTTRRWMPWWYHRLVAERVGPPPSDCARAVTMDSTACTVTASHVGHLWVRGVFLNGPMMLAWCDGVEDR